MSRNLIALLAITLTGCSAFTTRTITQVPVPIECRETVPERPVMPTEQFADKPTLDQYTQAAQAELKRREGYEVKLRTALVICTTPIQQ